jgi:hypothetical protein
VEEPFKRQIESIARPLLKRGSGCAWEHTLRAIECARYLLEHEEREETIVIPTLCLHDVGWSEVYFNDLMNIPPAHKRGTMSVSVRLRYP